MQGPLDGELNRKITGQTGVHNDTIYSLWQAVRLVSPPGKLIECFPGIFFVLFTRTMAVLFRRGIMKTEMHRVMIATAIVMWIIATGVRNPRFTIRHQACCEPCCHL